MSRTDHYRRMCNIRVKTRRLIKENKIAVPYDCAWCELPYRDDDPLEAHHLSPDPFDVEFVHGTCHREHHANEQRIQAFEERGEGWRANLAAIRLLVPEAPKAQTQRPVALPWWKKAITAAFVWLTSLLGDKDTHA